MPAYGYPPPALRKPHHPLTLLEVAAPEAAAWDVELTFGDDTVLRLRRS